eukprot:Cvel_18916.t1-p1 / transcript=Cvel_18916.t1 / gene=Cvel_18916 / organism=Chromera_velia_CCMP2878 / gene_product=cAMP-dependent protein kinase type II regulatory, putative / transcript_product=cAMP-dependent protein kinase type II regulatory, putative / location=Cvel_scaffold1595:194-4419(-) / protein_length=288 / sequence_SO=supercontig / SO=protein_coding / is_pseudo=false
MGCGAGQKAVDASGGSALAPSAIGIPTGKGSQQIGVNDTKDSKFNRKTSSHGKNEKKTLGRFGRNNRRGAPARPLFLKSVKEKGTLDLARNDSEQLEEEEEGPEVELSEEERHFLNACLKKHFLFATLEDDEISHVLKRIKRMEVPAGEAVFKAGDDGDDCFIVQEGSFLMEVKGKEMEERLERGVIFGELGILYECVRTAVVKSENDGMLWRLSGTALRNALRRADKENASHRRLTDTELIRSVIGKSVSEKQISQLLSQMERRSFKARQEVVVLGDVATEVLLLAS